jgi:fermentation-respiration switch protein FrsA (DUF1100 family)
MIAPAADGCKRQLANCQLPGQESRPATLTMLAGIASVPAVVLVHGSGPNDRDGTGGVNKPFKDVATGLASRGIAVLRYDKRTRVHGASVAAQNV